MTRGDVSVFSATSRHARGRRSEAGTVAQYLGIQQTVYSRYERGARTIPLEHLIKLADFYDVSLDFLTGRTQKMKVNR